MSCSVGVCAGECVVIMNLLLYICTSLPPHDLALAFREKASHAMVFLLLACSSCFSSVSHGSHDMMLGAKGIVIQWRMNGPSAFVERGRKRHHPVVRTRPSHPKIER